MAAGKAIVVWDERDRQFDYKLLPEPEVRDGHPAQPTPASLTANDARLVAGLHGRSRTKGMAEEDRLVRVDPLTRRPLPAEDPVERAEAKLKYYRAPVPGTTPDRAVRVYPKAS